LKWNLLTKSQNSFALYDVHITEEQPLLSGERVKLIPTGAQKGIKEHFFVVFLLPQPFGIQRLRGGQ